MCQPLTDRPQVGRIVIPDAHREPYPQEASVVAVGPKVKLPIRVGDRVLTDAFAGQRVEVGGVVQRLLDEKDVIAVVEQAL